MNARLGAGIAIVVLGLGGGYGYLQWRAGSEIEARRSQILRAVAIELDGELDPGELGGLLRSIARESEGGPRHPDLRRAEARIRLALGNPADAWKLVGDVAMSPGGDSRDRWIGALALMRLHAEQGDLGKGHDAARLARSYYDESHDVAALFAAWQLAYRTDDSAGWVEIGALLSQQHADTLEAETASSIEHFMAGHLATRRGVVGTVDELRARSKSTADDELRTLIDRYLATAETAAEATMDSMLALDRRWGDSPPELTVLLARAQIALAEREKNQDDLHLAIDTLNSALARYPTYVEARHLAAIAYYGLEQSQQQQSYLRWLLQNATEDDARRRDWQNQIR